MCKFREGTNQRATGLEQWSDEDGEDIRAELPRKNMESLGDQIVKKH